jgi:four helix bundle protein
MRSDKPRDLCQRTFLFACAIVEFCQCLSKEPGVKRHIGEQLLRAGTSVGANVEEAKSCVLATRIRLKEQPGAEGSPGSAVLAAAHHRPALAPHEEVQPLLSEADELVAIFIATVRTAKAHLTKQ